MVNLHYNKLREAVLFWSVRAFSYYILQTFWLLVITFAILAFMNSQLSPDNFLPKSTGETTIESEALIDTLLGTIGSLRCGVTGIVIGTVTGAMSGTFGYRQKMQDAEKKAELAALYKNNVLKLIQIIKIQNWFIIGFMVLAPSLWIITTKFNTRFFAVHEQILWLCCLYLTIAHLAKIIILIVMLLYVMRVVWRLLTIKPFKDTKYLSRVFG